MKAILILKSIVWDIFYIIRTKKVAYLFQDKTIETDEEGFLLNKDDWSSDLMYEIAKSLKLELTSDHIIVINTVRKYYEEYATTPAIRALIALLKKEGLENLADSISLAVLFPDGAAKCAAKLAGLPKPAKCI